MLTPTPALPAVLGACALALVLAACGSSGSGDATSAAPASSSADTGGSWAVSDCSAIAPPVVGALPEGAVVEGEVATTTDLAAAPIVGILEGAVPATTLVVSDVVAGSGDAVVAGATVTVDYCGVGLSSGAVFDSSWARGEPATFPLDAVITGWQEGIPGIQPGGRRVLVIPGDMAYGATPPPGSGIEPGETLVFVVDLVAGP